ncbi:MAG: tyrosine-type recombinase/integrase [Lachnospiraceae bacterium]|nr:tyrosine-type recombinase/integrase [Lachnospiraceae bacterium]
MYEEYFVKLREECLIRNRTEGTLATYTFSIHKFMEWTGYKEPESFTLEDARNYIYELRVVQNKSTQYCNGVNSALKFFYRFVLHKSWDQDAVPRMMNDVILPRVTELENVEKMIDAAAEIRNKAIIALLYSSGLRVSELCRLAPTDIYKSTMQVHIRAGKNHCDHWTLLSQRALDLLTEYWRSYPAKRDYLFVGLKSPHNPLRPSGVEIMVRKIGTEVGIDHAHPHMLRHSFASHMVEQGVSLEHIQAMMGHRDSDSTHRYIHVSNKALMGIKSPLDHPVKKKRGRKKKNEQ